MPLIGTSGLTSIGLLRVGLLTNPTRHFVGSWLARPTRSSILPTPSQRARLGYAATHERLHSAILLFIFLVLV